MKPTATEARILRNEGGLFQEMIGEQGWEFFDEIRAAFEHSDDAFAGVLLISAIRDYAEGLDGEPKAEPDAAHESRLIDEGNRIAVNADRY